MTAGDLKAAIAAGPAFISALERILTGAGTLADAETIAEDVIAAAVMVDPALAPLATLVEIGFELEPFVVAAGFTIAPGTSGEGWTTPPEGGYKGR